MACGPCNPCHGHTAECAETSSHVQVVREASDRVLGLRPFDVQLIGGMVSLALEHAFDHCCKSLHHACLQLDAHVDACCG